MNFLLTDKQLWAQAAAQVRFEGENREVMQLTNAAAEGRAAGLRLYARAQEPDKLRRLLRRIVVCAACYTLGAVCAVGYLCCLVRGCAGGMIAMLALGLTSCVAAEACDMRETRGKTRVTTHSAVRQKARARTRQRH